MRDSLNKIAENIAFSLGDQFNMTLREAIKHTVGIYRETLIRQEDFNSGLNYNDFSQNITLPLKIWEHPICGRGKITVNEIPDSIRFKNRGRVNYLYVGNTSFGHAYTQTTFAEYPFVKQLRYNIDVIYYVVENNKIIILNNFKACELGIIGVFAKPQNAAEFCDNVDKVTDDLPYPIGGDLLNIIKRGILSGEFPIRQMGEDGVIKSNSADEQLQQKS